MNEKKWLTLPFWTALIGAAAVMIVTLGIVSAEEGAVWEELLIGMVAAILPIVALISGYANERAARAQFIRENTPPWMTAEFWLTVAGVVFSVLVGLRVVSQEEADTWQNLLAPAVAAVLAIVAYVRGKLIVTTAVTVRGLM